MNEAMTYDDELREYRNRQARKEIDYRRSEKERIAELERKAAGYDAMLKYRDTEKERNGGWTDEELKKMGEFARGFINGWALDRSALANLCHWETFADDIDIHFFAPDERERDGTNGIEAFGYRRTPRPETGDHSCTDEVKLI